MPFWNSSYMKFIMVGIKELWEVIKFVFNEIITNLGWKNSCTWKKILNSRWFFKHHTLFSFRILLHLGFILASFLFLAVNLTCAMLVHGDVPENQLKWTVFVRALINDSLFILCAISLVSYICKITKMSSANVYLESKVSLISNSNPIHHIWMRNLCCFFEKVLWGQLHF